MGKSQYIIQFGGLPVGIHEFEFDVDDKFFQSIEHSEIGKARLNVVAALTKQNHLLQVDFTIKGEIGSECDRCLKQFGMPVDVHEKLVIKYGDPEESNDEILVIKEGETEFDVAQYIYEYAAVALPARKVPCEDDADFECDWEALDKLENISTDFEREDSETNNPMWEQLKQLKQKQSKN